MQIPNTGAVPNIVRVDGGGALRLKSAGLLRALMLTVLAALAACAPKPPPPPPPPPLEAEPIPARPAAPNGAPASIVVPPVDAFGVRQTVNANLSPEQTVWNLRSALNVAALSCPVPQRDAITDAYAAFLNAHEKKLSAMNRALDDTYREEHGTRYRIEREDYMTKVYNYFALPPVLRDFCNSALSVSQDALNVPSDSLETFAAGALPRLETVFDRFFSEFEQYQRDVAAWDAQYGAEYGHIYRIDADARYDPVAPGGNVAPSAVAGTQPNSAASESTTLSAGPAASAGPVASAAPPRIDP